MDRMDFGRESGHTPKKKSNLFDEMLDALMSATDEVVSEEVESFSFVWVRLPDGSVQGHLLIPPPEDDYDEDDDDYSSWAESYYNGDDLVFEEPNKTNAYVAAYLAPTN